MSDQLFIRESKLRPVTPWSLPVSVFAEYQWDTLDRLVECFEFDWQQIKLPKMSEDELKEVKLALWNCYKNIKSIYRYFSAHGASSNLAQIPLNSYTEYVKGIKLVDGKEVKFAASDTEFISITKRTKKTNLNPGNALIRSQFLEILARLALRRYENSQVSKEQAIHKFQSLNLDPFQTYDTQNFRETKLWVEPVDNILKAHYPMLEHLYLKFGGHWVKPGEKPFMMCDEFLSIWQHAELLSDTFTDRHISICFFQGMMTQVNEQDKDRHLKANIVEFLEQFCRAAHILSITEEQARQAMGEDDLEDSFSLSASRVTEEEDGLDEDVDDIDTDKKNQPLHRKVLHTLKVLFPHCFSNDFKKKWKWPMINPKTGLFDEKLCKQYF